MGNIKKEKHTISQSFNSPAQGIGYIIDRQILPYSDDFRLPLTIPNCSHNGPLIRNNCINLRRVAHGFNEEVQLEVLGVLRADTKFCILYLVAVLLVSCNCNCDLYAVTMTANCCSTVLDNLANWKSTVMTMTAF